MRKVANFYYEKKKRKNVVSYINEKAEKIRNTRKKMNKMSIKQRKWNQLTHCAQEICWQKIQDTERDGAKYIYTYTNQIE